MKTKSIVLAGVLMAIALPAVCSIPSFEMKKKPLAPEDPSLILAGIGGAGIAAAYLRSKLRK